MDDTFERSLEERMEALMADPRLVELCELQRTGDEVLDVIKLSENQHSDLLAWMLDPKEGHGQGDEILRDLLIGASTRANSGDSGLKGSGVTARFFKQWPPSRIRTTGFGTAFTARELGMVSSERVDLFVVDTHNRFVLLIENKAGGSHNENQLYLYQDYFRRAVENNPRLREYDQVYIALDREFDDEEDERPAEGAWLHLGYDWLKTSATRALRHIERGNTAARLVVSYCNRQTDWENPDDKRRQQLAVTLLRAHTQAIAELLRRPRERVEREWLNNKKGVDDYLLFLLQNRGVMDLLKKTRGLPSVKAAIHEAIPTLAPDSVEHDRAWLYVCPRGWEAYESQIGWPVHFSVQVPDAAQELYAFDLRLRNHAARTAEEANWLRERLSAVDARFGKFQQGKTRRVVLGKDLDLSELLQRLAAMEARLHQALRG